MLPKKSLGQNFLKDKNVLKLIVLNGKIDQKSNIIEIGPGTGNLTKLLIEKKPKKIIVIEKDTNLSKNLDVIFKNQINVLNKDFLKVEDKYIKYSNIIVFGNLPYNLSTQILIKLIKTLNNGIEIKKLVLMFQKEVADRIIAKFNTKEYGRLSIVSQWRMNIKKIKDVSPFCFYPSPKVISSILLFEPKKDFYKFKDFKNLEYITKILFSHRRKMIKKPFRILFNNSDIIFRRLNINPNLRPQKLSTETIYKICVEYEKII